MHYEVAIGLGANQGDKVSHLREAVQFFKSLRSSGAWAQSSLYKTTPVDCPEGSPDFYNAVITFETTLTPEALLEECKKLEKSLGRLKDSRTGLKNAPRALDADILYFGEFTVNTENLAIPHVRLTERKFVLQPLSDIRPDLILPEQSFTISELLTALDTSEPDLTLVEHYW